ncbi:hypothetical protein [Nocardia vermiculata]|uniref:hypothetical protein n=1 Tax=Nocardia vermiculata TaxID=257274 RepID=UPI001B35393D|nr:hypothetical protein [Nocardia vermiculata]
MTEQEVHPEAGVQHIRDVAAPSLSAEDLGALDELLDITSPHNLLRRDDLALRSQRTVWAARRP